MICDGSRGDVVRVQLHLVVVMDVKVGQIVGAGRLADAYPCQRHLARNHVRR